MQKLLTIDLKAEDDGKVREHLVNEFRDGWQVSSVMAAGAGQNQYRSFLVVVLLEK